MKHNPHKTYDLKTYKGSKARVVIDIPLEEYHHIFQELSTGDEEEPEIHIGNVFVQALREEDGEYWIDCSLVRLDG